MRKHANPEVLLRQDERVKAGRRIATRSPNICPPRLIAPFSWEKG
jgi:hypothetical protein